ncbi:MAG: pseudaminic acid synthase [Dehalococcoidia bacterium]
MIGKEYIEINGRRVGRGYPTYVIAEMSGNHNLDFGRAIEIIHMAKDNGADAVKLQTYTPDTMTIDCDEPPFILPETNTWGGTSLYKLYQTAYTPWEWQADLIKAAREIGIDCFSTPFDSTAVDFLEELDVPVYKVASFEVMDIPLLRRIAQTGRPMLISTGMATIGQIDEAVQTVLSEGAKDILLLQCASAYPAPPSSLNLRTIPNMAETWHTPIGFSDHSLGIAAALASVALGACLIEKHVTLSRADGGPDAEFSLEPHELRELTSGVKVVEQALGSVAYGPSDAERGNVVFQRSIFAVADIKAGDKLTVDNVRVIRPGNGLAPKFLDQILGLRTGRDIKRGAPINWNVLSS